MFVSGPDPFGKYGRGVGSAGFCPQLAEEGETVIGEKDLRLVRICEACGVLFSETTGDWTAVPGCEQNTRLGWCQRCAAEIDRQADALDASENVTSANREKS